MEEFSRHLYRYLVSFIVFIVAGGTVFYHYVEKFSWLDAYYFCITTLATVGYGDFSPKTSAGKLFTTLYIVVGIGTFSAFITLTMKRRGAVIRHRQSDKEGLYKK
jgi:voltage-gated potassium channel